MAKAKKFDPVERKRLRKELNEKYLSQANYIRAKGKPSPVITTEIELTRKQLKIVDRKSVGHDYEDKAIKPHSTRNPRRLKRPWYCSRPECGNTIPNGQKKIMLKKRHYCSVKCATKDNGFTSITIEAK